jgi:predicted DNA-binding ribbon-helix-helix protein
MFGAIDMTTLTIRLPEDTSLRLKQLAASRGMSLNKLIEELSTAALAAHDAETRFRVLAASADRNAALDILARLDELDRSRTS